MRRNPFPAQGLLRALVLIFAFTPVIACAPAAVEQQPASVIYLVRHAEKSEENPQDPELTEAGQARANLLVHLLENVELDGVWSTDTRRTRNTATPTAQAHGVTIELYNPSDMAEFAQTLKAGGGQHLVVGHSNTTTAFVEALGGDPGTAIVDPEYDRFYIVFTAPDGHVETASLQFGEPFTGG